MGYLANGSISETLWIYLLFTGKELKSVNRVVLPGGAWRLAYLLQLKIPTACSNQISLIALFTLLTLLFYSAFAFINSKMLGCWNKIAI